MIKKGKMKVRVSCQNTMGPPVGTVETNPPYWMMGPATGAPAYTVNVGTVNNASPSSPYGTTKLNRVKYLTI